MRANVVRSRRLPLPEEACGMVPDLPLSFSWSEAGGEEVRGDLVVRSGQTGERSWKATCPLVGPRLMCLSWAVTAWAV